MSSLFTVPVVVVVVVALLMLLCYCNVMRFAESGPWTRLLYFKKKTAMTQ